MHRLALAALTAVCAAVAQPQPSSRTEFIELDAVVVDSNGQPARGLRRDAFQIKEDRRDVEIVSVTEMSAADATNVADTRSIVLLLDDTGMNPTATQVVQFIAQMFISRITVHGSNEPTVAVVRLTHSEDEPFGDRNEALRRIGEYRSGSYPFLSDATQSSLKTLAKLATRLQSRAHQRKIIVGIGRPRFMNVSLQPPQRDDLLWPYWVDAVGAMARANAALFVVDPAGPTGMLDAIEPGLVIETGGQIFTASDFRRSVDLIWTEASHYYLIRYVAPAGRRELHSIDIKSNQSGLQVRARRSRGD